ncbi:MAG: hypothetical protein QOK02_1279, partial [Mycobacterium sp.]|nr:hypothetical protein [Mycobacterium sp.]
THGRHEIIDTSSSVREEVSRWFFDAYLPIWVGVASGTIQMGPEFILDYWGVPLHYCTPDASLWLLDDTAVVRLLERRHRDLRAQNYSLTAVPDRKVTVYHPTGAAIEVIWSRRRATGTEIERIAVHFEVARGSTGWRVVGIQAAPTSANDLTAAWAK